MRINKSGAANPTERGSETPVERAIGAIESELWRSLKATSDDSALEVRILFTVNAGDKVKIQVQHTRNPGWIDATSERFFDKYLQAKKSDGVPASAAQAIVEQTAVVASRFFWGAKDGRWSSSANHTLTLIVKGGTVTGKQQISHDQMFPDGIAEIL